jgi:hypothetical protein
VQRSHDPRSGQPASCRSCRHFDDDPRSLEARLPGLTILGSAYSSTRADAGLCAILDRFQSPIDAAACLHFVPRPRPR